MIYSDKSNNDREEFLYLSRGSCTRTNKGVSHVFRAISDCTLVVLLTKKWNDCDVPIVHENLGMGDGDHGDPNSPFNKT